MSESSVYKEFFVFTVFTVIFKPMAMSHSVGTQTHPYNDTGPVYSCNFAGVYVASPQL